MARRGLILALCALLAPGAAVAQGDGAIRSGEVLVLPFANHSGRQEAYESVLPVFYDRLDSLGLQVMSQDELRPILRTHRIRVVGQAGERAMDVLREATGARLAIVGSIDIYEPTQSLEILLSARLLDLESHLMVSAISVGRTVQETEKAFGLGRAEAIPAVIDPVVTEFMAGLAGPIAGGEALPPSSHECGKVAVIPLDDYSQRRHGAAVLENLLISELVARGWQVVEPGVIHENLLDARQMARGGVSNAVLEILRDRIGACFVVTGELEEFFVTPSGVESAVPRIGFGLRLIDARSGELLAAINRTRDGADGETIFAHGREYSMARLARSAMAGVVTWIEEEGDQ